MESTGLKKIIPKNILGIKSRAKESTETNSLEEAIALFELARLRMLAVNHWHDMAGVMSAVFQLTDKDGELLFKSAEVGNLIRIDIPGPVTLEKEVYEWVKIESVTHQKTANSELVIMQLKPTPNPTWHSDEMLYFYKNVAITSFIIERNGNKITAFEKNEISKINGNFFDEIRNIIVLHTTKIRLVNLNWNALLESWIYNQ